LKKTLSYFLLALFFLTSGYGTFYCLAKKAFGQTELVSVDFEQTEKETEDQKEKEKEEKEKEREKEKNGFFDCFFEYDNNSTDLLVANSYFRDSGMKLQISGYCTEVFSPPELAVI
jgi:ABC-type transport system involved in cytochrome bd biosynthesis fused ATPase/permease subunit